MCRVKPINSSHHVNTANSFSMSLDEIAEILSAKRTGENVIVKGISTDTRNIEDGELFIALKGPNFDGHKFVQEALNKGAIACLVSSDIQDKNAVITTDTHQALGLLAKAWRQKINKPIIAITGSNGKTTVKEMIASIFQQNQSVMATFGNLNNDIGVPLTLYRLNKNIDIAIVEMGANHKDEIDYLTNIALPDVAVITNIGTAHLEGFGSLENTAKAKAEIFNGLSESGIAIINADDPFYNYFKKITAGYNVLSFALKNKADISCKYESNNEGSILEVVTPKGDCKINLKLLGRHNVMNALAAISARFHAAGSMPAYSTNHKVK